MAALPIDEHEPPAWVAEIVGPDRLKTFRPRSLWILLLRQSDVPASRLTVAAIYMTYMSARSTAWPSQRTLAAGTRMHTSTIGESVQDLNDRGWVDVDRPSQRKALEVTLCWPADRPEGMRPCTPSEQPECADPMGAECADDTGTECADLMGTQPECADPMGTECADLLPECAGDPRTRRPGEGDQQKEGAAGPDLATRCLAVLDPAPKRLEETRAEILMLLTKLRRAHSDKAIGQALDDLVGSGWTGEYCNRDLRGPLTAQLAGQRRPPATLAEEFGRVHARHVAAGRYPDESDGLDEIAREYGHDQDLAAAARAAFDDELTTARPAA